MSALRCSTSASCSRASVRQSGAVAMTCDDGAFYLDALTSIVLVLTRIVYWRVRTANDKVFVLALRNDARSFTPRSVESGLSLTSSIDSSSSAK